MLCCVCLVVQSCLILCDPIDCSLPGVSVHGNSPGKNIGMGCHALLQGIFPTQELNSGLLHCGWILYQLSCQENQKHVLPICKLTPKQLNPECNLPTSSTSTLEATHTTIPSPGLLPHSDRGFTQLSSLGSIF